MITTGTNGVIRPEIRQPQRKDESIIWQPQINFFKTDFGSDTPVSVPALNAQVNTNFNRYLGWEFYNFCYSF